jgi:hypothetical protein
MYIKFLILFFLFNSAMCSEKCQLIMANWLINPDNLPSEVYMDSGKFINDLGDYNNCLYNR